VKEKQIGDRERGGELKRLLSDGEKFLKKTPATMQQTLMVVAACGDAQHISPIVLLRLPLHPGCFLS